MAVNIKNVTELLQQKIANADSSDNIDDAAKYKNMITDTNVCQAMTDIGSQQ